MAQKKTYIYRMLIGNYYNGKENIFIDIFMYAPNSKKAKDFCKEKYHDKKYNYYKVIKVGLSYTLQDTQILQEYESEKLRNSIASKSDKYSEREVEAPKFIPIEEARDLV